MLLRDEVLDLDGEEVFGGLLSSRHGLSWTRSALSGNDGVWQETAVKSRLNLMWGMIADASQDAKLAPERV
jgi:hypothetical protein